MRIAQIIPGFIVGGGELLATRLCSEIIRLKPTYSVFLISLYDKMPTVVYKEALDSGAHVICLGKKTGFNPFTLFQMISVLKKIKPDVIHTHLAGLRYTLPAGLLRCNSLKIHTVHNMASRETSAFLTRVHKIAFKNLDWIPVALSESVKESIHDVYDVDAPVVNNGVGIHTSPMSKTKKEIRHLLGIPEHNSVVISIGRLCKQKNQALLIDAFRTLCERKSGLYLLIVGDDKTGGNYRRMLEEKVNSFPDSIRMSIRFLGIRADIPELLLCSDLFVLSSDWEGVPLTLLEAMGYGTPVVSTSVGGVPDVVDHKENGVLVSKGNVQKLCQAMQDVLMDRSYANRLSRNAQMKFGKCYSITNTAEKYLDLYERYLKCAENS